MNTEKIQQEFEQAIVKMHVETGLSLVVAESFLETGSRGYTSIYTKAAWWAWQASRDAIEIQLPKIRDFYGSSSECEEGYEVWEVEEAIESVGLRVKL